eukprot:TRINITY_DN6848_c0_g1_i14.p2 TRINITY_DN6848_c0_g1~~TRINITY_DN6848_c0_g1_i14.p2  ORF type:complete len:179 (-),score=14.37 TRINITY_DN6848_c0_g1_i14:205-741(-)
MRIFLFSLLTVFALCQNRPSHCHFTCATCSKDNDSKACTSCSRSARLRQGRCRCPRGLGMTNDGECAPCHPSCRTCALTERHTHCHSCKDPRATLTEALIPCIMIYPPPPECDHYERQVGACICPNGSAPAENGLCEDERPQGKCFANAHMVETPNGKHCECNDGYYFDHNKPGCVRY